MKRTDHTWDRYSRRTRNDKTRSNQGHPLDPLNYNSERRILTPQFRSNCSFCLIFDYFILQHTTIDDISVHSSARHIDMSPILEIRVDSDRTLTMRIVDDMEIDLSAILDCKNRILIMTWICTFPKHQVTGNACLITKLMVTCPRQNNDLIEALMIIWRPKRKSFYNVFNYYHRRNYL